MFASGIRARAIACITLAVALGGVAAGQDPVAKTGKQLPRSAAQRILDRYYSLIHGAKTIQLSMQNVLNGTTIRDEVMLKRPFKYRANETSSAKVDVWHCSRYMTGKVSYLVSPNTKSVTVSNRAPGSPQIPGFEPFNEAKRPDYTLSGSVWEATLGPKRATNSWGATGPEA